MVVLLSFANCYAFSTGFRGDASSENPACQLRRPVRYGPKSGSRRSPRGEHGSPVQYSYLENPMDKRTWQAIVDRSQRARHDRNNLTHTHAYILNTSLISNICLENIIFSLFIFLFILNNVFSRESFVLLI